MLMYTTDACTTYTHTHTRERVHEYMYNHRQVISLVARVACPSLYVFEVFTVKQLSDLIMYNLHNNTWKMVAFMITLRTIFTGLLPPPH